MEIKLVSDGKCELCGDERRLLFPIVLNSEFKIVCQRCRDNILNDQDNTVASE
jgi:hypothetical protein